MNGEVLSIGSEILAGEITDTNATFLAQQFITLGVNLRRVTQVGDDLGDIRDALASARAHAQLVVCTGGIGPTPDDLSREALATLLGEEMRVVPELETRLRSYFTGRGAAMPERNLKQAMLIPSAEAITNRSGTAPGWWVESQGTRFILLPGVPHEMKTIWQEELLPRLIGLSGTYTASETIKTFGLGESTVAEKLGNLWEQTRPAVGTYAKRDGVHVVLRASGPDPEEVRATIAATAAQVRALLGDTVWNSGGGTLTEEIGTLLRSSGLTVSTVEDATGGLLAMELRSTTSTQFAGGVIGQGAPPATDLLLRVGPATAKEGNDVSMVGCDVSLLASNAEVATTRVHTPSSAVLADRATFAALDLLRRHLHATVPD